MQSHDLQGHLNTVRNKFHFHFRHSQSECWLAWWEYKPGLSSLPDELTAFVIRPGATTTHAPELHTYVFQHPQSKHKD